MTAFESQRMFDHEYKYFTEKCTSYFLNIYSITKTNVSLICIDVIYIHGCNYIIIYNVGMGWWTKKQSSLPFDFTENAYSLHMRVLS